MRDLAIASLFGAGVPAEGKTTTWSLPLAKHWLYRYMTHHVAFFVELLKPFVILYAGNIPSVPGNRKSQFLNPFPPGSMFSNICGVVFYFRFRIWDYSTAHAKHVLSFSQSHRQHIPEFSTSQSIAKHSSSFFQGQAGQDLHYQSALWCLVPDTGDDPFSTFELWILIYFPNFFSPLCFLEFEWNLPFRNQTPLCIRRQLARISAVFQQ